MKHTPRLSALLLPLILAAVTVTAGCSIFAGAPRQNQKGPEIVLVLWKESGFKSEVLTRVRSSLEPRGYRLVVDTTDRAKHYNSADYGAVVYMAEYWMWHTPFHAKRYFRRNKDARNTLFVITSGDPDVAIDKPFDAVTTASRPERIEPVADEITAKLLRILE